MVLINENTPYRLDILTVKKLRHVGLYRSKTLSINVESLINAGYLLGVKHRKDDVIIEFKDLDDIKKNINILFKEVMYSGVFADKRKVNALCYALNKAFNAGKQLETTKEALND